MEATFSSWSLKSAARTRRRTSPTCPTTTWSRLRPTSWNDPQKRPIMLTENQNTFFSALKRSCRRAWCTRSLRSSGDELEPSISSWCMQGVTLCFLKWFSGALVAVEDLRARFVFQPLGICVGEGPTLNWAIFSNCEIQINPPKLWRKPGKSQQWVMNSLTQSWAFNRKLTICSLYPFFLI